MCKPRPIVVQVSTSFNAQFQRTAAFSTRATDAMQAGKLEAASCCREARGKAIIILLTEERSAVRPSMATPHDFYPISQRIARQPHIKRLLWIIASATEIVPVVHVVVFHARPSINNNNNNIPSSRSFTYRRPRALPSYCTWLNSIKQRAFSNVWVQLKSRSSYLTLATLLDIIINLGLQ